MRLPLPSTSSSWCTPIRQKIKQKNRIPLRNTTTSNKNNSNFLLLMPLCRIINYSHLYVRSNISNNIRTQRPKHVCQRFPNTNAFVFTKHLPINCFGLLIRHPPPILSLYTFASHFLPARRPYLVRNPFKHHRKHP